MAIIFSPLNDVELDGPFKPLPRTAFVMVQTNPYISKVEDELSNVVDEELKKKKFSSVRAADISGQKDYLDKIIQTLRGCAFGVAIFSHATPPSTLANIFFEVGLAYVFGKQVILVKTVDSRPPSDFNRTEWVDYSLGKMGEFKANFGRAIAKIEKEGTFWRQLADVALEAEHLDPELAFERYKQAFLITGAAADLSKIKDIQALLKASDRMDVMEQTQRKMSKAVSEFISLGSKVVAAKA